MTDSEKLPFYVVASDMDGTLLQPDHTVTAHTSEVLTNLQKIPGLNFVLATGRHHTDVLMTKKKLNLHGYVLTSNGARVHDDKDNVVIRFDISPVIVRKLCMITASNEEIVTNIYKGDKWLMNKHALDLTEYYKENNFTYELFDPLGEAKVFEEAVKQNSGNKSAAEVEVETAAEAYNDVYKVYYTSDNRQALEEVLQAIQTQYPTDVSAAFTLPNSLEVTSFGVNKGTTMDKLVHKLGHTLSECIAFGDGMNDKEMLQMAGCGILVGNAQADLKAALPHNQRIGTNAESAVPKYIEMLFKSHLEKVQ